MEAAALANLLRANELAIVRMQVPDFMLALDSELPASHCAKRDALWKKILPLVEASKYGEFFSEGRMGPLISSIAEKTGTKKKPMYTLLYRAVSNTKRNTGLINSVGRML